MVGAETAQSSNIEKRWKGIFYLDMKDYMDIGKDNKKASELRIEESNGKH